MPTLLPVVSTLGAMGWLGLGLDVGSAMVATVVLGVAIDDAIHFLFAYQNERGAGESVDRALATALRRVGAALIATSIALSVGFTALALSPWASVARFGGVAALATIGALAADLLLLPALLFTLFGKRSRCGRRRWHW